MAEKPIGFGCDHGGFDLKAVIVDALEKVGLVVRDFGTFSRESMDYPDVGHALANALAAGEIARGVLVCGTGVGMSIAVNRHPDVRAVVCSEPLSARMSRRHNDANVLCLGARVIGPDTALEIVHTFISESFEGGRHARRVAKINLP